MLCLETGPLERHNDKALGRCRDRARRQRGDGALERRGDRALGGAGTGLSAARGRGSRRRGDECLSSGASRAPEQLAHAAHKERRLRRVRRAAPGGPPRWAARRELCAHQTGHEAITTHRPAEEGPRTTQRHQTHLQRRGGTQRDVCRVRAAERGCGGPPRQDTPHRRPGGRGGWGRAQASTLQIFMATAHS